ncbi:hypothetical protein ACGCUQ_08030 [Eubacteriales bacterium KG127]
MFGGLTLSEVFTQLSSTFMAGIFFAVSYRYTKNTWILEILDGLWDCISLSRIGKIYPIIDGIVIFIMIMEIAISCILLRKYYKEID